MTIPFIQSPLIPPDSLRSFTHSSTPILQTSLTTSVGSLTKAFFDLAYIAKVHSINVPAFELKGRGLLKSNSIGNFQEDMLEVYCMFVTNPKSRETVEKNLERKLRDCKTFDEMAYIFYLITTYSEDKSRKTLAMSSYWNFLRRHFRQSNKALSKQSLMYLLRGALALQTKTRENIALTLQTTQDNNIAVALDNILASLCRPVDNHLENMNTDELVLTSSVYFRAQSDSGHIVQKLDAHLNSKILHQIERKFGKFTLVQLITILDSVEKIKHLAMYKLGTGDSPDLGRYTPISPTSSHTESLEKCTLISQVRGMWVKRLSDDLKGLDTRDLADAIYSLSFFHSSQLCKHLIAHNLYTTPISTVVENRIKFLLEEDKSQDYYNLSQLLLILPQESELRETLGKMPLDKIFSNLPNKRLVELLHIAKYDGPQMNDRPEVLAFLEELSTRVTLGRLKLPFRGLISLLEQSQKLKNKNAVNNVVYHYIGGLDLSHPFKGYHRLLKASKYFLCLPEADRPPGIKDLLLTKIPETFEGFGAEDLETILGYMNSPTDGAIQKVLSLALTADLQAAKLETIASILEKLCTLGVRHDALVQRFIDQLTTQFRVHDVTKWSSLASIMRSVSNLRIYSVTLNNFAREILGDAEHKFDSLGLVDRINFLHAFSLIDASDLTFEEKFLRVVEEFANVKRQMSDPNACSNLYGMYINRLFANSANPNMKNSSANKKFALMNKVMQEWPCYHWFKNEEKLLMQFQNSLDYLTIRESLVDAGADSVESKITELYFCNFVLEGPKLAIICIPEASTLRWLASSEVDDNQIGHALIEFGDYSRRIEHLRRSNWKVALVYLSEWHKLDKEARMNYIKQNVLPKDVENEAERNE